MATKTLSRQRQWQLKMQREGKCLICGKSAKGLRCPTHAEIHAQRMRDHRAKPK